MSHGSRHRGNPGRAAKMKVSASQGVLGHSGRAHLPGVARAGAGLGLGFL